MSTKKVGKSKYLNLKKRIDNKFPEYKAKLYANRRNSCIHMWLDQAIFAFLNFKQVITEIDVFLNEHLPNKFICNYPKLIHSTKWKFDYIVAPKKING